MILVQASSTPRTIRSISRLEKARFCKNWRTQCRTNQRFAGWLANSIFFFICGRWSEWSSRHEVTYPLDAQLLLQSKLRRSAPIHSVAEPVLFLADPWRKVLGIY